MSIQIDKDMCCGCGRCSAVCPGMLIEHDADKKAQIVYPKDCWGCASCLKECPAGAIKFYLAADIGGHGAVMQIKRQGNITQWIINKENSTTIIKTDSKAANKY